MARALSSIRGDTDIHIIASSRLNSICYQSKRNAYGGPLDVVSYDVVAHAACPLLPIGQALIYNPNYLLTELQSLA